MMERNQWKKGTHEAKKKNLFFIYYFYCTLYTVHAPQCTFALALTNDKNAGVQSKDRAQYIEN